MSTPPSESTNKSHSLDAGASGIGDGLTSGDSPVTGDSIEEAVLAEVRVRPAAARAKDPALVAERRHLLVQTPFGGLYVVAAEGVVVAVYHEDHDPTPGPVGLGRPLCTPDGRSMKVVAGATAAGSEASAADTGVLRQACQELAEYFEGRRRSFSFPMTTTGTAFQEDVWRALAQIPFGERRSYRDVAESLGNPAMGRAIGAAVRANPLSIVIPGHRVVSSSGEVVGYSAGAGVKSALLDFEWSLRAPSEPEGPGVQSPPGAPNPVHSRRASPEVPADSGRG